MPVDSEVSWIRAGGMGGGLYIGLAGREEGFKAWLNVTYRVLRQGCMM